MDEQELQGYAVNIHKNTVQCMQNLLENSENLNIPIEDETLKVCIQMLPHVANSSRLAQIMWNPLYSTQTRRGSPNP